MKKLLLALWLASAGQVFAGPLEDAAAAYGRNDFGTALRLLMPLAEAGNASAQYNLGFLYDSGRGAPQDQQMAAFWYGKSAEQGHASAQFNLGVAYSKGEGVVKDDPRALYWYRKSADQGDTRGQYNLGLAYAKGEGVPMDDEQSYFWLLLASAGGDATCISSRDFVETRLSPKQRLATQEVARDWKPRSQ